MVIIEVRALAGFKYLTLSFSCGIFNSDCFYFKFWLFKSLIKQTRRYKLVSLPYTRFSIIQNCTDYM